ncbi:hypothetical protein MBLNU13_g07412t2 [Cladosporium sp. NU13]
MHVSINKIHDASNLPIVLKDTGLQEVGHNNYACFQSGKTEIFFKGWNSFNARALKSNIRVRDIEFETCTETRGFYPTDGTLLNKTSGRTLHATPKITPTSVISTFQTKTRLIDVPKAEPFLSCEDKGVMVIFVDLRGPDKDGKLLIHLAVPIDNTPYKSIANVPKKETASILHASHRAFFEKRSIHSQLPFQDHDKENKIHPGEIVRLENGIWARCVNFDAGEFISVQVGGQLPIIAECLAWSKSRLEEEEKNKGMHKIRSGLNHTSSVIHLSVSLQTEQGRELRSYLS